MRRLLAINVHLKKYKGTANPKSEATIFLVQEIPNTIKKYYSNFKIVGLITD